MERDAAWAVVAEIEQLVNERRAGRAVGLVELDPLTWELLTLWAATEAEFERAHQARMRQLFEALARQGMEC